MNQLAIRDWSHAIELARPDFEAIADHNKLLAVAEEIEFASQAFKKNQELAKCNVHSIRDAVVNVASVGLSLNPAQGLAYLVPRKGICCLDIAYKGLIKLATDSGAILWAKAELVRQNDEYEWKGVAEMPHHRTDNPFNEEARGPVIGGYCVAETADHVVLCEQMSAKQLADVESVAKGPVWRGLFGDEMRKKTLIKRAFKTWPKSNPRMSGAIALINEHEGMVVNDGDAALDDNLVEIISPATLAEIHKGMELTGAEEGPMLEFLNRTYDTSYTSLETIRAEHAEVLQYNLNRKLDKIAEKTA